MSGTAIEMRAINKSFGPVKALVEADLVVEPGTIHGLVGQNGAGKSTIIKVLAGIFRRDSGLVSVFGRQLDTITPASIEAEGIHFIHQDRLLVPTATVAEAIFLRNEPQLGPFINYRQMNHRSAELMKRYFDVEIDPSTLISELSTAEQKIVQITRALAQEVKVLVLDEPTAALVNREVESLFALLRRLKADGLAIVFISHYMAEIAEICDVVTILRNGSNAGVVDPREVGVDKVVELMTDRDTSEMYPGRIVEVGDPVLSVRGLSVSGHFEDVSFDLHAGEILGLTGLLGSGDKEVMKTLFGQALPDAGEMRLRGDVQTFHSPVDAVRNGIAKIPEDRRAHGVATGLSVGENISLASLDQVSRAGLVDRGAEAKTIDGLIADLGIKTPGRETLVKNLSGGNQQKVVVAKWLSCNSQVYLMDEPTVAVDVGAKVEIYRLMNRLAGEGKALIFVSSDLEEVTEMCDRVLVIYRGRITGEFKRGQIDPERLRAFASGANIPEEKVSAQ